MLPSFVIVGAHHIPITYKRVLEGEDEENCISGLFFPDDFRIEIKEKLRSTRMAEIILHETLHAINATYGFVDQEQEERTVTTLAAALTKLAQDNPEFIQQWLHHACKQ